jgi:hypothetical protein
MKLLGSDYARFAGAMAARLGITAGTLGSLYRIATPCAAGLWIGGLGPREPVRK